MPTIKNALITTAFLSQLATGLAWADGHAKQVDDAVISEQRSALESATRGKGFGPQAPRDIDEVAGQNTLDFGNAPARTAMNLCNIHFHKGAEHRGGDFTTYAGNGDGKGYGTGFVYDGDLTSAETSAVNYSIGFGDEKKTLVPGDTIEIHYVHTTAKITPGPTLGACLSESIMNPQLRVEAQVFVVVNDDAAANFEELMEVTLVGGFHQAPNIPFYTGTPVVYDGSTTGPSYNEKASPLQVTWSVRPEVLKVSARSVANWLADNDFDERGAHGVRNLVTNLALLAPIE